MKKPILFIVFNRPETTKIVFEAIRKIKPKELFIAADGPRLSRIGEFELCQKTRKITENIDWKCKVQRLYRRSNLGCGKSVSSAINWFFKHVEQGIILEDDCLPNKSFFEFCDKMLDLYTGNGQIMHISGDNFTLLNKQGKNKYYLSKYPHVWGWATWRRSWQQYDYHMNVWRVKNLFQKIKFIEGSIWDKLYWTAKFDSVAYESTDTWDYQWLYAIFKNKGLSIVPGVNLIRNIGFGKDSTHTTDGKFFLSNLKTDSLGENLILGDEDSFAKLDEYERKDVFKINSVDTIIHFVYFSIFCMIYNKLNKKFNYE